MLYEVITHNVPVAIQVADIGGPIAVSALLACSNGVLYEALRAMRRKQPQPRRLWLGSAVAWGLTLAYGAYRIHEVV